MEAPLNLDDASGLKYRIGPGIIIGSGGPADSKDLREMKVGELKCKVTKSENLG